MIHDLRNSLVDLTHQKPRLTGVRIVAIGAGLRFLLTNAGKRYQWAVDNADDRTNGDSVWRSQQAVATLRPAPALQQTYFFQLKKNGLKELGRGICVGGDVLDQNRTLSVLARQEVERSQRVLAFSR